MPLTTADVVAAAVVTLDEVGLVDLTMRRLGDELGVRAGAIYYHVPNKQTLLALIADHVLAEVPAPAGELRVGLGAWACGVRAALLAHRDAAEIVFSARAMGLLRTDPLAAPARFLRAEGLSEADARGAAGTLLTFVLGHVVEEQARELWERFGPPGRRQPAATDEHTFHLGVDVVLTGIAAVARPEVRESTSYPARPDHPNRAPRTGDRPAHGGTDEDRRTR